MSQFSLTCLITCQIRACLMCFASGIEGSCGGAEQEMYL
jgi:hypothetical protein